MGIELFKCFGYLSPGSAAAPVYHDRLSRGSADIVFSGCLWYQMLGFGLPVGNSGTRACSVLPLLRLGEPLCVTPPDTPPEVLGHPCH